MDRRDFVNYYKSDTEFDEQHMTLTYEDGEGHLIEVHAVYEVCPTCHGRGHHVNPSIDAHGLTSEDFAEDPDFAEAYFSGFYDETCRECNGKRVVPMPDERYLEAKILAAKLDEDEAQTHQDYRTMMHECGYFEY